MTFYRSFSSDDRQWSLKPRPPFPWAMIICLFLLAIAYIAHSY